MTPNIRINECVNVDLIKVDKCEYDIEKKQYIIPEYAKALRDRETLTDNTILFTNFDSKLTSCQYLPYQDSYMDEDMQIFIYRKTPMESVYKYIGNIQGEEYLLYDYNIVNNEYYHYLIGVLNNTQDGPVTLLYEQKKDETDKDSVVYNNVTFNNWSICDIEPLNTTTVESSDDEDDTEDNIYVASSDTWTLGFNMTDESLTQNLGINAWETLSQYGKISMSQKNFISGQFKGLLGNFVKFESLDIGGTSAKIDGKVYNKINGQWVLATGSTEERYTERLKINDPYSTEMQKLQEWKKFCSNGKLKLLRDLKGNGWIVAITGTPTQNISLQSNLKQTEITFDWQEMADISKCSIIGGDTLDA